MTVLSFRRFAQATTMLLLCLAVPWAMAQSAPDPANIVSSFLSQYSEARWPDTILKTTTYLFWSLATISAVWTFGMLLLRQADIGAALGELLRFIVATGIFYWLLKEAGGKDGFVETIVFSMRDLGGQLVGSTSSLQGPANAIANIGLSVFNTVVDQSINWKETDVLIGFALATLIVVVLALVAAQVALMLVGAWMLAYGGIFLLGFGGARWTSAIAIGYYKHVLAVALSMLALILLLSIGQDFLVALHAQMRGAVNLRALAVMLVLAIVLLVLCVKVPGMLFNVVTGAQLGALTATASMAGNAIVVGGSAAWSSVRHVNESSTRMSSTTEKGPPSVDAVEAYRKVSAALVEAQNDAVYRPLEYHQYGIGGGASNDVRTGSVFQASNQPPGGHVHTRDVNAQQKADVQADGSSGMGQAHAAAGAASTAGREPVSTSPGSNVVGTLQASAVTDAGQAAVASTSTGAARGEHSVETRHNPSSASPIGATTSDEHRRVEQGGISDALRRTGGTEATSTTTGVQSASRTPDPDHGRRDGSINEAIRRNTSQEQQASASAAPNHRADGQARDSDSAPRSAASRFRPGMSDARAAPRADGQTGDGASAFHSTTGGFRAGAPDARVASARKADAARKKNPHAKPKPEKDTRDKSTVSGVDKKGGKAKSGANTQKNDGTPSRLKSDQRTRGSQTASPDEEVAAFRDRDSGGSALFGEGGDDVA